MIGALKDNQSEQKNNRITQQRKLERVEKDRRYKIG